MTAQVELAFNTWDGPDPHTGAVVVDGDHALMVDQVAEGAGVGHWTLWCHPVLLIRLQPGTMG